MRSNWTIILKVLYLVYMCGRYGFSIKDKKEFYDRFEISNKLNTLKSRYNISPGQKNPVITKHSPNQVQLMYWGLIPYWAKTDSFRYKTINARIEGIDTKPVYKKAFATQRCIIPATFFYEWDKSAKPSQPYYFGLKNNELFGFAGLYDIWKNPKTGDEIRSYTIITTVANSIVSRVHPRMPIILNKEIEDDWLNPDIIEPDQLYALLAKNDHQDMISYPVSTNLNKPKTDSKELIAPIKI